MKFINKFNLYAFLSLAFLVWSCDEFDTDVEDVNVSSGSADFSTYVALGNSLTAGYADGTLYKSGQENSFPSMIAQQTQAAGGGSFNQPLMLDDVGGFSDLFTATGSFYGKLQLAPGSTSPAPSAPQHTLAETFVSGTFNNMGVPGAKSYHLLANGYGNPAGISAGLANPYFARFASSATTSVLADAAVQAPTFFSLWIGNNDVLGFASSGGEGVNQAGNIDPSTYGSNDISDPNVVGGAIQQILETLVVNGGAKGVIANIPSVSDTPYFTTVAYNVIEFEEGDPNIDALNNGYATYNTTLDALVGTYITQSEADSRKISFSAGANPVVFIDNNLTDLTAINPALVSMRQAKEGELVLLTAAASLNTGTGASSPLGSEHVLTESELGQINMATEAYNTVISQLAANYDIALVDANAMMKDLNDQSGITIDGATYTTSFIQGGAFSLDGVHLTPRGYAIVANAFIDAINAKYGSTLAYVNPNSYPGIVIP